MPVLTSWHDQEVKFFKKIAIISNCNEILPKVYLSRECPSRDCFEGVYILMENREGVNAEYLRNRGLTKGQVQFIKISSEFKCDFQIESAIETIARFHANSLALPPKLIEQMSPEIPFNFEVSQKFNYNVYPKIQNEAKRMHEKLLALSNNDSYFKKHDKALQKFLEENASMAQHSPHELFGDNFALLTMF